MVSSAPVFVALQEFECEWVRPAACPVQALRTYFTASGPSAIDAAQAYAIDEQRHGIGAQRCDRHVHGIAIRSVLRALSIPARRQPSRIGIEDAPMNAFAAYINAV